MTRAEIVAEARSWVGTPFHWQASIKGVGADCKGLVWGVARELGLPEAQTLHASAADYGPVVDAQRLLAGLRATFRPVAKGEEQPGDVVVLLHHGKPQHLGIYTGRGIVHASMRGRAQVVEMPCTRDWRSMVHSAWGWGAVADG